MPDGGQQLFGAGLAPSLLGSRAIMAGIITFSRAENSGQQVVELEDESDRARCGTSGQLGRGQRDDVRAAEEDLAARGEVERTDAVQQRGLARHPRPPRSWRSSPRYSVSADVVREDPQRRRSFRDRTPWSSGRPESSTDFTSAVGSVAAAHGVKLRVSRRNALVQKPRFPLGPKPRQRYAAAIFTVSTRRWGGLRRAS